ncbi:57 kDa zinc finger-containing protein kinase, partial [Listeria monocytogenes FSL F2-208]
KNKQKFCIASHKNQRLIANHLDIGLVKYLLSKDRFDQKNNLSIL